MFCEQELCVIDFHLAVLHEHSEFPVERWGGKVSQKKEKELNRAGTGKEKKSTYPTNQC
jgi:hypothetical protein